MSPRARSRSSPRWNAGTSSSSADIAVAASSAHAGSHAIPSIAPAAPPADASAHHVSWLVSTGSTS